MTTFGHLLLFAKNNNRYPMWIGSASNKFRTRTRSPTKKLAGLTRLAGSILGAFCYENDKFLNLKELCQQTNAAI